MPNPHSVEAAIAWVDAATHPLNGEDVPLCKARGRVLTDPSVLSGRSLPAIARHWTDLLSTQARL